MRFLVKHKKYTYSILLSFIIIIVIRYITNSINSIPKLLMDASINSCICIIADMAWNAPGAGIKVASRFIKNDMSFLYLLTAAIVPSIYYAVILNFTGLYLSFGDFVPSFLRMYIEGMPLSFIVGYIVSICVTLLFTAMEKAVNRQQTKTKDSKESFLC